MLNSEHDAEFLKIVEARFKEANSLPIKPSSKENNYFTSFSQKRHYFVSNLNSKIFYSDTLLVIEIIEDINLTRLNIAVKELLDRYEILRTSFKMVEGKLIQNIMPNSFTRVDYRSVRSENVDKVIEEFMKNPDGVGEPLRNPLLLEVLEKGHLLLFDTKNTVLDAYSRYRLKADLQCLYKGQSMSKVEYQYKDYGEWRRGAINLEATTQKDFWLSELNGQINKLELPTDYSKPISRSYLTNELVFDINTQQTASLKTISNKSNVNLTIILMSLYQVLMAKLSNLPDLVIGVSISDRNINGLKEIVGDMNNVLPLRTYPNGEKKFLEFLKETNAKFGHCVAHGICAYETILDILKIEQDDIRSPLLEAVFRPTEENWPNDTRSGWSIRKNDGQRISYFDISLAVLRTEDTIQMKFEYSIDLFNSHTIGRYVDYFKALVSSVVTKPDIKLGQIGIITENEQSNLLDKVNNHLTYQNSDSSIIRIFEKRAHANAEKVAVLQHGQEYTYGQINSEANKLARLLKYHQLTSGQVVAVLLDRSADYIITTLAVLKSGAMFMPIDLNNPDERINYILKDSRTQYTVTNESTINNRKIHLSSTIIYLDGKQELANEFIPQEESIEPQSDIYVIYTSGSTGKPKGVVGTQKGLLNRLHWGWENFPYLESEICCQKTSISFIDHITEVFSPLLAGIPLAIYDYEEVIDANRFVSKIKQDQISRITLVPSLLSPIIRAKRTAKINLNNLKYVFCSGEALTTQLANEFYEEFSDCKLYIIYGSTEVSADATCHYVDRFDVQEILKYFRNLSTPQSYATQHLVKSSSTFEDNKAFTQPNVSLGMLADKLGDSALSSDPVSLEDYYDFLDQDVLPFTIDTASPTFIGHMTSVLPDYVHDLSKLISQMNQNLVKIETSKSITFLEREAIAILHRLFYSLPGKFYEDHIQKVNSNLGIITSGGTIANITALLTARNKGLYKSLENRVGNDKSIYSMLREQGYSDMVFIGTRLMHYSFKKALSILGLGANNMLFVENDAGGSMITSDLQEKIDYCRKEKLFIIAIVGIAGSTERGSVDPLVDLGNIARKNNIHFHVDAAWGGALMFSDKYKHLLTGIEQADSITFCGHKQLFLPQGISVCLFKDPSHLGFNSTTANYQAQPNSYDFGRFTIEGSRPGLSICLHASLRILGKQGFGLLVENGIENAKLFTQIIDQVEGFELLSRHMNIINYRYIPQELRANWKIYKLTEDQVETINQVNFDIQQHQFYKGETFVSKTTIQDYAGRDIIVFRVVLSNPLTTHEDLVKVIEDQIVIIGELYKDHNHFAKDIKTVTQKITDTSKPSRYAYRVPIGRPIANTSIFILDAYDNLQPIGVPGEICISGSGLTSGYLFNESLTEQSIQKNPYLDGELMYRTGDLGRWNIDGTVDFLGRKDHQVKIRGNRVELSEIENALNEYDDIDESVVMLSNALEEDAHLVAFVVSSSQSDVRNIKNYLSGKLPNYMIPTIILNIEALPLTVNGKVDRKILLDQLNDGHWQVAKRQPPETEIQKTIGKIWTSFTGTKQLSLGDTFFDIGGHSLLMINVLKEINEHFQIDLPLNISLDMTLGQISDEISDRILSKEEI